MGDVCVKRALPRLRVAQRWEAPVERNRYERLWLETAGDAAPGAAPRVLASDDGAGLFAMQYLPLPVWKERLRQGDARPAFAAQVGAHARGDPLRHRGPAGGRRALRHRRDLLRHPPRALSRRHRDRASRPATADPVARATHRADQSVPGARRRQPEEHPGRQPWTGVPRCGMRLVRRSGLRPRVLPEPPAAEMPLGTRPRAALPGVLRCALGGVSRGGSFREGGTPHRHPAAGAAARARRRQVAGRISDGASEGSWSAESRASCFRPQPRSSRFADAWQRSST